MSPGKRFSRWLGKTWFAYALVWVLLRVFNRLPLRVGRWVGRRIGRLYYHFARRHRPRCLAQVALAFPEKTVPEQLDIVRRCYEHLGLCAVDFCHFLNLKPEELRRDWIVPEDGAEENARAALALGKGVVGVSAHIGFWELCGFSFPALGYPLVSIARKLNSDRLDVLVLQIRQRLGNVVVHKKGALRVMLRALHENKTVGLIMDQYAGLHNPQARFFGRKTPTLDSCARLHLRTGAPLVLNLMLRRPDGRYAWRCRPIAPAAAPAEDEQARVIQILEACNQAFEEAIRDYPEQWLWMHRRWR